MLVLVHYPRVAKPYSSAFFACLQAASVCGVVRQRRFGRPATIDSAWAWKGISTGTLCAARASGGYPFFVFLSGCCMQASVLR